MRIGDQIEQLNAPVKGTSNGPAGVALYRKGFNDGRDLAARLAQGQDRAVEALRQLACARAEEDAVIQPEEVLEILG